MEIASFGLGLAWLVDTKFKDFMVKDRADDKVAVCNVCKKRTRRTWALMAQNSDPPQFCHYNCIFANI